MANDQVVVMGASVGGVEALARIVAGLSPAFPAPILVVQHIGNFPSILPELLSRSSPLPVTHGVDGDALESGRVYVAPPDFHMTVEDGRIRLARGPKEHHSRPAIDPLFVSAALAYGAGVVGVVLTGMLDDGTAGLQAIKRCGGIAIVQDPREAEAPSMPASALRRVDVDHCVRLDEIAATLVAALDTMRDVPAPAAPVQLVHEHDLTLAKGNAMEHLEAIGQPSTFACPDCNGALWLVDGSAPPRYRCHTGHGFSARSLLNALTEATDTALWGAVRAVQEEQLLLQEMARTKRAEGDEVGAAHFERAALKVEERAQALRGIVETVPSAAVDDVADFRQGGARGD